MINGTITVYSHFYIVDTITETFNKATLEYAKNFYYEQIFLNKNGEVISNNSRMFASANSSRTSFRFHFNSLEGFHRHLSAWGFTKDEYTVIHSPTPPYKEANFPFLDGFTPREHQIPVIDYIVDNKHPNFKLLGLDTGEGKTISTFFAMSKMKMRTAVVMRPGYINRWMDEINKVFIKDSVKCLTVIGSDSLKKLIIGSKEGTLDFDVVLISDRTFQSYLKICKNDPNIIEELGYFCEPKDFFEVIGVGFRVIDEVHQDFHLNFMIDLNTNVARSLSLSATLVSRDKVLEKMYEIAYPKHLRYHTKEVKKFGNMTTIFYSICDKYKIRTSHRGTNAYNHIVYENSIVKHPKLLNSYLTMIDDQVDSIFLKDRKSDDKAIIFAGSVEMCSNITNYIANKHPEISCYKYTSGDSYSNLIDPVIRVTTPGSGGTAHDIKGLSASFSAISVDSLQTTLQVKGRIRDNKEADLKFIYFIDTGVPKQVRYHRRRKDLLKEKVNNMNEWVYPKVLC